MNLIQVKFKIQFKKIIKNFWEKNVKNKKRKNNLVKLITNKANNLKIIIYLMRLSNFKITNINKIFRKKDKKNNKILFNSIIRILFLKIINLWIILIKNNKAIINFNNLTLTKMNNNVSKYIFTYLF